MDRITEKQIQAIIDSINKELGAPMVPYERKNGKLVAQLGNYHLDCAYGGYGISKMVTDGGGVSEPIFIGHTTKRECYNQARAYLMGIRARK